MNEKVPIFDKSEMKNEEGGEGGEDEVAGDGETTGERGVRGRER